MEDPKLRFLRSMSDAEHRIKARIGLAGCLECASCGEDAARHAYVLSTSDGRSYVYALCGPCHLGMARLRASPEDEEGPVGMAGPPRSGRVIGPIVANIEEAWDRFVAAGEPDL